VLTQRKLDFQDVLNVPTLTLTYYAHQVRADPTPLSYVCTQGNCAVPRMKEFPWGEPIHTGIHIIQYCNSQCQELRLLIFLQYVVKSQLGHSKLSYPEKTA